ncbi:AAA family ATPase [Actinoplanes sp. NPDC051346]|uniref:helix-turn-helix transcriptional regulator n=1 Tax=Actinoplanes sp. NPDC051346 TaxID=3155048 RepID=UPI00343EA339
MGHQVLDGDRRRDTLPLVGRVVELAALRAVLYGHGDGPAVLVVAGDPGIGKTRLLAELLAEARREGRLVLSGGATEFEREVPFGVLRNALEDHLRGWHPATLEAADLHLLPNAFRALAADGSGDPSELLAGERYRLHRAVRAVLETIAGPAGLVLVLDDLHWADDGSLELLDHLMRHPPRAPVLLAVGYRPRQASTRLLQTLAGASQRGLATTIEVGPLSAAEAADLLPADLNPMRRERLYRATGGNPFYLQVLARIATADPQPVDLHATGPVDTALAGEFATLAPPHRQVLHAAAVSGDEFDPGLVGAVAALAEPDVLVALDELEQRDLIRPGSAPGRFRFRHPLLRSAAYHHARAAWRLGAHARAAAELSERRAPVDVRAPHIVASAAVGDLAAVDLLRTAAVEAMHATPAAAAHWLGAALRLLPREPATTVLRLGLLNLRGRALGVTGRLGESREILGEILRLLPVGDPQRVTAVSFLAILQNLIGDHTEARALLTKELAALPEQDGLSAGVLRVGLILTSVMCGPSDTADVGEAIRVARGTGNRPLLAFALSVGAVASHSFDVTDPHTPAWLDEAGRLVDAMPDSELAERLDTVTFVSWGELYRERFDAARRHLERALRVARGSGQSHVIGALRTLLGVLSSMTGQLTRALVHLEDARESAVLTGSPQTHARVLSYRSWVSVWRGELDEAVALGEQAVALAATGGDSTDWQGGSTEIYLGFARYAAGDPAAGLELLVRGGHTAGRISVRPVWRARWYQWLAAAAADAGDDREAASWAARADDLPAVDDLPRRAGFIHLAHVHATRRGDPTAAAAHAVRAAAAFERAGDRIGAAQAHLYAGAAYRDLGSTAAAGREIAAARLGFAACGAAPHWLETLTSVSLLSSNEPVVSPEAALRLTPRELSILRLLAESLTAAAIARRLGISPGTVHKHLGRLYRKLGTTDRLATVLRAREAGLLPR